MKNLTLKQTLLLAALAFNLTQCSKPEQSQNEPAAVKKAEANKAAAEAKEAPKAAKPTEAQKAAPVAEAAPAAA